MTNNEKGNVGSRKDKTSREELCNRFGKTLESNPGRDKRSTNHWGPKQIILNYCKTLPICNITSQYNKRGANRERGEQKKTKRSQRCNPGTHRSWNMQNNYGHSKSDSNKRLQVIQITSK